MLVRKNNNRKAKMQTTLFYGFLLTLNNCVRIYRIYTHAIKIKTSNFIDKSSKDINNS